jgi:hypothetical protein
MTEHGEFRFTVKETHDGKSWIAFESAGDKIKGVQGLLGLDLKAGTTHLKAKEIAQYLNNNVKSLSLTT